MCFLNKDKIDKQTHVLETPPKCWNSLPRRQVDGKMIMQIMLKKAVVTSGWRFLGRRPDLLKVANIGGQNTPFDLTKDIFGIVKRKSYEISSEQRYRRFHRLKW